jgi:hypothetical protein
METKICSTCQTKKPISEFYDSKTHSHGKASVCKSCFNIYCQQRWIERKIKAIIYKGSKCVDCGLSYPNTHYAVYEFHHLNPEQKEFNWTKMRLRNWDSVKKELDKCDLLCANCHRIRHTLM